MDFDRWNEEFGGEESLKALEEAKKNNGQYQEVPDGTYNCKLEKLELGETKNGGKPMIKAQFRIMEGEHKKQCLFVNQVFTRGFPQHKGLEFLRSLQIFDDSEVDFDGSFSDLNDLLLDMAEEAEANQMRFRVSKTQDGEYSRIEVLEAL